MTDAIEKTGFMEWCAVKRPLAGQNVSGDSCVVKRFGQTVLLGVIDGVGHGAEASHAARLAVEVLKQHGAESVISLVHRCHEALAQTRGAVITLACVDRSEETVAWLGVGNVEARLYRANREAVPAREEALVRAGLVGFKLPSLHAGVVPVARGDILVFATDGLDAGFDSDVIVSNSPRQIANALLTRRFKGIDDALALVARYTAGP
ncbi:MAG: SpoIIE family protein phosphatase [Verrucomicrobia bacterium]|nr:SpoIIE family protein phosphatase [Verrucomicrobiota bacterium]MDE3099432.1 SpoIIE family protein phosphatase [Verrucomicrobiota bacterium]